VTAARAEADAVCAGLMGTWSASRARASAGPPGPLAQEWERQLLTTSTLGPYVGRRRGPVTVLAAGAGGPAAAAGTATALAVAAAGDEPFSLVLSMGTAGGFRGRAGVGDILVADRLVAADLGAESGAAEDPDISAGRPSRLNELDASLGFAEPRLSVAAEPGGDRLGGFLSLDDLGLGTGSFTPEGTLVRRVANALAGAGRPVVTGTVITVATVTGTERRASALARRFDPVGEAMEGYAVGVAASAFGVPVAELRAVSNSVGRRDRSAWDLPSALAGLRTAAGALVNHSEGLLAAEFTSTDFTGAGFGNSVRSVAGRGG
jgi:futalosine hydrolase